LRAAFSAATLIMAPFSLSPLPLRDPMQTSTIVTMVVILSLVWGGFAVLLVMALRKESHKNHGTSDANPSGGEQRGRAVD